MICASEGCGRPLRSRGLCHMHYQRLRSGRDLKSPMRAAVGEPLLFLKQAANTSVDDCILWPFARAGKNGAYGQVFYNGRMTTPSNAVCELAHGPAPSLEHEAAHSCRNSLCCNPHHVRWATPAENEADKIGHGTSYLTRKRDGFGRFIGKEDTL